MPKAQTQLRDLSSKDSRAEVRRKVEQLLCNPVSGPSAVYKQAWVFYPQQPFPQIGAHSLSVPLSLDSEISIAAGENLSQMNVSL